MRHTQRDTHKKSEGYEGMVFLIEAVCHSKETNVVSEAIVDCRIVVQNKTYFFKMRAIMAGLCSMMSRKDEAMTQF